MMSSQLVAGFTILEVLSTLVLLTALFGLYNVGIDQYAQQVRLVASLSQAKIWANEAALLVRSKGSISGRASEVFPTRPVTSFTTAFATDYHIQATTKQSSVSFRVPFPTRIQSSNLLISENEGRNITVSADLYPPTLAETEKYLLYRIQAD